MADSRVDRVELLRRIDRITIWRRGDRRAPHKPLLLLMALGRVLGGKSRLGSYGRDFEGQLRQLLDRFGPPRKAQHPEQPFSRLPGDGLWEIPGYDRLPKSGSGRPRIAGLRESMGGFPADLDLLLRSDPALAVEAAQQILDAHFPQSLHSEIRDAAGIPEYLHPRSRKAAVREPRDPRFRHRVLRAYERRCAVCGWDVRVEDQLLGLEAAHIKWHAAGGPDAVRNGLAMCSFHHKALDVGALGLEGASGGVRVLISSEISGQSAGIHQLLGFRDALLRTPRSMEEHPDRSFLDWHRREVFREPALGPGG